MSMRKLSFLQNGQNIFTLIVQDAHFTREAEKAEKNLS
jgi:hypothetical protein